MRQIYFAIIFFLFPLIAQAETEFNHFSYVTIKFESTAIRSRVLQSNSDEHSKLKTIGCTNEECTLELMTSNKAPYGIFDITIGRNSSYKCRIVIIDGYQSLWPSYYTPPECRRLKLLGPLVGNSESGYRTILTT